MLFPTDRLLSLATMRILTLFIIMSMFALQDCGAQVANGGTAEKSAQANPDVATDNVKKVGIQHAEEPKRKEVLYERGMGTFYATSMHGHRTANGERHDKNALVCAHKKLPFGTLIRVVNEKNKKETVVRVNDRGPFGKGKVIDLSMAAAKELDMVRSGVVPVTLYVLEDF